MNVGVCGWHLTHIQCNDFEFSGAVKMMCCVVLRTKTTAQKNTKGAKIFYPKRGKRDNLGKRGSLGNRDFNPVPLFNLYFIFIIFHFIYVLLCIP
jgi:hypothetical protein